MEYYNGSFYQDTTNEKQQQFQSEPSQIELLSGLIEESESTKKSNPETEKSKREEAEYWKRRIDEEERILKRVAMDHLDEVDDNDVDYTSVSGHSKIEEVDKLKGTRAEKLDPNIWTVEDLELLDNDGDDDRETPDYEIIYQQDVSSTDVYLGMDPEKDPSTMSSDSIVYAIKLPKAKSLSEIELNISTKVFSIKTEHYSLNVHFPQPVLDNEAKAKWNSKSKTLNLSVPFVK